MALDLTGIHNVGEFYSHHYLEAVLGSDLKDVLESWSQREKESGQAAPNKRLARLAETYFKARHQASQEREPAERWSRAREFHAQLLEALGYDYQPTVEALPDQRVVPLLLSQRRDGRPFLWVVDAPFPSHEDDSPLDEQPLSEQLPGDASEAALAEASWRELLDGPVFKQESPPRWVLFMGGEDVFLIDHYKWGQGKYLRFELGDLLSRRQDAALKATAALLHREVLNPEDGLCRHDALDEASHKHAFAVSTDLKYGARAAIELLGNEAVRYKREVAKEAVFSNDQLARQLTEECLVYLYRLLFLFYVEARGAELGVVPMQSDAFRQG
ncbi:MAG: hypothetical protein KC910_28410, partial [Candidatus Eremiobacteraeota bacterium]|nr:hypothetical protein [Candidatus Eremiobacteraeota bacterium]